MGTVIGSDIEIDVLKNYKGKITNIYGNSTQEVIPAEEGKTVTGFDLDITDADLTKENQLLIEGHSEQETTEGKNLLNLNAATAYRACTIQLQNNSIKIVTDGTNNAIVRIPCVLIAGNYYLHFEGDSNIINVAFYNSNDEKIIASNPNSSRVIILSENLAYININLSNVAGTYNLSFDKLYINLGSTDLGYEPYTGGQSSPNPSYPQAIQSVGDNVNLFDKDNVTTGKYYSGTTIETSINWNIAQVPVKKNTSYYLSGNNYNNTYARIWLLDENKNRLSEVGNYPNTHLIITTNETYYIGLSIANYENASDMDTIKLEEGTQASSYSPYNMGIATIEKSNKNLFDKNDVINAYINIANGEPVANSTFRASGFIHVGGLSNIVVSGNYGASEGNAFYDKDKNFISGFSMGTNTTKSSTVPNNAVYMRCTVRNNVLDQYQLEEGTQATSYVAHQSQTYSIYTQAPMRSIGDVRDDFVKQAGVWYERHKIGRLVFNGSENNWNNVGGQAPYQIAVSNLFRDNSIVVVKSNYFIGAAYSDNWGSFDALITTNTSSQTTPCIRVKYSSVNSLDDFKTWLATHNTEVIYILAEPTLLPCTSEQIEVLEEMKDGELYEDYTNITSLDDIQPNLNLHYNFVTPAPSPDRESPIYSVADNNSINITVANEDETEMQSFTITTQQPFRKIGDVFDDFVKQAGVWYERHKIYEYTYLGTETGGLISSGALYRFNIPNTLITPADNNTKGVCMSNKYLAKSYNDLALDTEKTGVCIANNYDNRIYVSANGKTREQVSDSLIGTKFYYQLAEPTLTECTAAQVEQLEALQNILLYTGINHITNTNIPQATMVLEYNKIVEDYDFYVSTEGFLVVPKSNIKYLIDPIESSIPSMPEASETSVRIAGTDGDIPLMTTYEPIPFNIVCYTEDNLTPDEKVEEETKLNNFMNSIKNSTKQLVFETEEKLYDVKYNGALTIARYPKHIKFSIPLKSSKSYAKYFIERTASGNATFESNTIKEVGPVFTILGPATNPRIALNNYQMYYDSSLSAGEKLIIDSGKSTVTLIDTNGDKFNAMGYYNHEFPKIKNGTNILEVKAGISDANQLKLNWYDLKF